MNIKNMRKPNEEGQWGKVKAFFDVENSGFEMKGFRIIEGINGLFVSMPSRKGTDDEGNEEWRKIFNDFRCGFGGWIHQTDDGGFLIVSEMDVAKLDSDYNVVWNAVSPKGFQKFFNNGMVSGINHDMKKIDGGAIMVGYGSSDWE